MSEKMHATINELIMKYEKNEYVFEKLSNYINKTHTNQPHH